MRLGILLTTIFLISCNGIGSRYYSLANTPFKIKLPSANISNTKNYFEYEDASSQTYFDFSIFEINTATDIQSWSQHLCYGNEGETDLPAPWDRQKSHEILSRTITEESIEIYEVRADCSPYLPAYVLIFNEKVYQISIFDRGANFDSESFHRAIASIQLK